MVESRVRTRDPTRWISCDRGNLALEREIPPADVIRYTGPFNNQTGGGRQA